MEWQIEMTDEGWLRVTTAGAFDADAYARMVDDILSSGFWRPDLPALFDHRALSTENTSFEDVLRASATHDGTDERIGAGRVALLVSSPETFGRARQFEQITQPRARMRLRVFLHEAAALAWVRGSDADPGALR